MRCGGGAGVYTLPPDARICDALEAAGGFTEEAATDAVNLAEVIRDAEQIWFPTEGGGKKPGREILRRETVIPPWERRMEGSI